MTMEPLKDQFFNAEIFKQYTQLLHANYSAINTEKMLSELLQDIEKYELKERLRNTTNITYSHLQLPYKEQTAILSKVAPSFKGNFFGMIFPDFVEVYGLEDMDTSFLALEHFTKYSSSEFAIRPFFKIDFDKTLKQMIAWSTHENYHVRRLSSEGSRAKLPWSFHLKEMIENPSITKPILENLKKDKELYVKKSVANHLNDITKDNPDYVLTLLKKWNKDNTDTFWIMKQALRTLVKKGNTDAMKLLGFNSEAKVELVHFHLDKKKVSLGEELTFECKITPTIKDYHSVVIDFAVHYQKSNGTTAPKVFKLKDVAFQNGKPVVLKKRVKFEDYTTRKHYSGEHFIELLANGVSLAKHPFTLFL